MIGDAEMMDVRCGQCHKLLARADGTATGLNLIDANAERSAAGAYKARQANISILIAALIDGLDAHAKRAAAEPRDYGYAGDLSNAQRRLEEMVASLAGMEA